MAAGANQSRSSPVRSDRTHYVSPCKTPHRFLVVLVLAGGKGYFAVQTINSTGQLAINIYDRQLMAISFSKSSMIEFNKMDRMLPRPWRAERSKTARNL